MKLLSLKLTHDGSFSVFENENLQMCYEFEKFGNNNRFKILNNLEDFQNLLNHSGHELEGFDKIIIDGWVGTSKSFIQIEDLKKFDLPVAPYQDSLAFPNPLTEFKFLDFKFKNKKFGYSSYFHVTNHILSAYMTSPFSKKEAASYVLVWDGGTFPTLYLVDPVKKEVSKLGSLFSLGVNIYSIFAQGFGPFKKNENVIKDELSIAGKVMAYIAYGKVQPELLHHFRKIYEALDNQKLSSDRVPDIPFIFLSNFKRLIKGTYFSDEDILTSFHFFLEDLLLSSLRKLTKSSTFHIENLCFSGGAALNIKWNSSLRKNSGFKIWVPPFPNDSGSSIGAGCTELFVNHKHSYINWNIYSGPEVLSKDSREDPLLSWNNRSYSPQDLALLLHESQKPIVILNGKAEIGPRALGNRSIISTACSLSQKNYINQIKFRESYRPVAPICLEAKASEIFTPGHADPYMLFDHTVKSEWKEKIPAALHEDGTARLQTVNKEQNTFLYDLLKAYEKLSGVPVLLNTSANFKGSGFFPDVQSVMRWGKVDYIFCDGLLFTRINQEMVV